MGIKKEVKSDLIRGERVSTLISIGGMRMTGEEGTAGGVAVL